MFVCKSLPGQQYPDTLSEWFLAPDLILLDRDRVCKSIEFDQVLLCSPHGRLRSSKTHHGPSTGHHTDTCWRAAHGYDDLDEWWSKLTGWWWVAYDSNHVAKTWVTWNVHKLQHHRSLVKMWRATTKPDHWGMQSASKKRSFASSPNTTAEVSKAITFPGNDWMSTRFRTMFYHTAS